MYIQYLMAPMATSFKSFHATGFSLYSLKTSENLWFSYIFRGYIETSSMSGLILAIATSHQCVIVDVKMRALHDHLGQGIQERTM